MVNLKKGFLTGDFYKSKLIQTGTNREQLVISGIKQILKSNCVERAKASEKCIWLRIHKEEAGLSGGKKSV